MGKIAAPLVQTSLMAVVVLLSGCAALAAEFRVDNKVFAAGRDEPASRSITLFCEGVVYDFMAAPAEVIVYDAAGGRFVLLDVAKKRQTELKTAELADFVEKLRKKAAESKEGRIRFLADPKFEETFAASTGRLTLTSPSLTYAAIVKRPAKEAAAQYYEFSDWLVQLNTRLNPACPVFARLALNKALAAHNVMATDVTLTTSTKGGQDRIVRSEHQMTDSLTQADRDRVAEAKKFMAEFTTVRFDDYRK